MIASGHCCGIRHRGSTADGAERNSADGELVSWFLTYPDGSMGMLYTEEVRKNPLLLSPTQTTLVWVILEDTLANVVSNH